MTWLIRRNGVWITPTQGQARKTNGIQTKIQTVKRRSGSSWVTAFTAYTPITLGGNLYRGGNYTCIGNASQCPVNASATTALGGAVTASGGTGSYTVSWAKISGTNFTVNSPTSLATTFTSVVNRNLGTVSAVYRCTVSDGVSSAYIDINVSLDYIWNDGSMS